MPCRLIRIPESKNCCFWNHESKKNLEFRLQLYESKFRLQLECGIQVPLSRNRESNAWNPESRECSPESKYVLRVSILPYI